MVNDRGDIAPVDQGMTLPPLSRRSVTVGSIVFCANSTSIITLSRLVSVKRHLSIRHVRDGPPAIRLQKARTFPLQKSGLDCTGSVETLSGQRFSLAVHAQTVNNTVGYIACILGAARLTDFVLLRFFRNSLIERSQRTTIRLIFICHCP